LTEISGGACQRRWAFGGGPARFTVTTASGGSGVGTLRWAVDQLTGTDDG
jgi:hypothetical protein